MRSRKTFYGILNYYPLSGEIMNDKSRYKENM